MKIDHKNDAGEQAEGERGTDEQQAARDCTIRREPWQRAELEWDRLQEMRCDLGGDR